MDMYLRSHVKHHRRILMDSDRDGKDSETLVLNVLLLGDKQSGRSSVGNALIGGDGFRTGPSVSGVSVTTQTQILTRTFPKYFRRNGAESDLVLKVMDTPPGKPRPQDVRALCLEGVHVVVIVIRADLIGEDSQLENIAEMLFGPDWSDHSLLVFTHVDRLKEAGLQTAAFLSQTADWLRSLASKVVGGVSFVEDSSDWPSLSGKLLRDKVLCLSARNHHQTLKPGTEL